MASDQEERNKVFGMPRGAGPHAREGREPQRVLGVPVDWFGPVDWGWAPLTQTPHQGLQALGTSPSWEPYRALTKRKLTLSRRALACASVRRG